MRLTQSVLDNMYQNRTLVFGHRGAKAYAPMNTIPAFEVAIQQGVDGVEVDVHLSKDREIVVLHDPTVDRTTNGSGRVKDMTLKQLKELDAGGWFAERFKNTKIPTLDEVFEEIGSKLYVNIEIKAETPDTEGLEQVVAERIARFGMQRRVIVSSFSFPVLQNFRRTMPEVPVGFLYEEPTHDSQVIALLENAGFEALHPRHTLIDVSSMLRAKDKGYRVNTWTVNEAARAVELRDLGVDLIITDNPDVILRALGR